MTGAIRRLAVRLDNAGDVLLAGPAVRALAADGPVDVLAGPAGAAATRLLPGVRDVITWAAPWIQENTDRPLDRSDVDSLLDRLTGRYDEAAIFTSFHQSPLPAAMLLRLAGIARIAATSVDHPGGLLDHRLPYRPELHEVEQQLLVADALDARLPAADRGALAVDEHRLTRYPGLGEGHVVIHPDASVTARSVPTGLVDTVTARLLDLGHHVVVTGGATPDLDPTPGHRSSTVDGTLTDLRGRTDWPTLAAVIADARVIITGNTGPAHLAATVGTPVVSIFAPVVPADRWGPWQVPTEILGDQHVACAGCRARRCPLPVQLCTAGITADTVLAAVDDLTGSPPEDPTAEPLDPGTRLAPMETRT